MKRNTLNSLLALVLLTLVMACKTKKAVVAVPPVAKVPVVVNDKKAENLKLLKSKDLPFNTLSLKGKVNVDMNGNAQDANITIRIKKDEKIWVSITAFAGIEVARALITPDSVLVRNNIQALSVKKPFSYLNSFTSKQVTFKMLQSVITGNTIADFTTEQAALHQNAGIFVLSGNKVDLSYKILFNSLLKSSEADLNDPKAGQALKVTYSDYQQVIEGLYPSVVTLNSMSGKKKTNLTFDFSKIERNVPLDFPFTVPKRFELIN
ncbi:DUF4292 domain-containing protein [Pedobacter sp. L105]|uniref:DUF4292 domain-containing protein n=1 Tax=Pedobacter sp. L105 TaxID=1641871 RepID=UPI00131CFD2D|nr:DUF4292 domain-containing protein [Pedobacter sp. L105]